MKNNHIKALFFLFLLVFLFFHHFFGYLGHYGYDDMEYARLAKLWVDGNFHLSNLNHFTYRWTIVGLTGLSYFVFGMNDFASAFPSLLVTISILFIVYWVTRKKSLWVSVIAMSLFVLNQWSLFYSDKIMPDLYIALSVFGAFATIWSYRFDTGQKYSFLHSFFFTGFLFMGFLTKETILLIVPVLMFIAIADLIQKRNIKFWIQSLIIGILMLVFYFILIRMKTGNIWIRFEAISLNSYINPCRYDLLPISELLERLSYQLWLEMICQVMFVGLIFIIPAIKIKSFREHLKMKEENSFLFMITIVTLLSLNFMTINFKAYVPMCVDARHYLYCIPLLAVSMAPYAEMFFSKRTGRISVPVIAFVMAIIAFSQGFTESLYFFIPFTLLCTYRSLIKAELSNKHQRIFFILLIAALFILPIIRIFNERKVGFRDISPMIQKHFKENKNNTLVFTDQVLKRVSDYYMQYDTLSTRFVSYYDIYKTRLRGDEKVYILINDYTTYMSALKWDMVPLFILDFKKNNYILEDSAFNMRLYRVIDRKCLLLKEKEEEYKYNCERDSSEGWSIKPPALTNEKAHSGKRSNLVPAGGYSVTLVKPLKEIANDSTLWIDVSVSCWAFLTEKIDATIICSFETMEGKSILWFGNPVTKDFKKYNQWDKVIYNNRIKLPPSSVNNTVFKIYVWNDTQKPVYIDDFVVKFECYNHL